MAVLLQETQDLMFNAWSSLDPDDSTHRVPFQFSWTCTAIDHVAQVRQEAQHTFTSTEMF